MNPGEVWRFEDGTTRLVVSHATYNASRANQVITAVIVGEPSSFQPFVVETAHGMVISDRLAMHPGHWLTERLGTIGVAELATVRRYLAFLLSGESDR